MQSNFKFKTTILVLFTILLLYNLLISQEWINVSPFIENNSWIDGDFISAEEGWIFSGSMAHSDTIYHTTDGAQTWEVIYSLEDPDEYIISLQMMDSQHGWMKKRWYDYPDGMYYYLKTSDGGYTWEDMGEYLSELSSLTYNGDLQPIYFINSEIGFICLYNNETQELMVYKTIDGGYNWYETETPIVYDDNGYEIHYGVTEFFFLNEQTGWTACASWNVGFVLYTDDGGETWTRIGELGQERYDIHFTNPNKGGTVGYYPGVRITEDNFETVAYQYGFGNWAIHYQDESTIWVVNSNGLGSQIYQSINGGASFEEYQLIDTSYLNKIQFFGNTGYIFGSDNSLLKFEDNSQINSGIIIDNKYSISVFPNPFNSETTIYYCFPENIQQATIKIYNIKGQKIKQITDIRNQTSVNWNGSNYGNRNVSSGIYLYQLNIDGKTKAIKKCLKLK